MDESEAHMTQIHASIRSDETWECSVGFSDGTVATAVGLDATDAYAMALAAKRRPWNGEEADSGE